MKPLVLVALAVAMSATSFGARADPTGPAAADAHVLRVPTVVIHGRPNKPLVVVIVKPRPAAEEAAEAHAALRAKLWQQLEPAAMRPSGAAAAH